MKHRGRCEGCEGGAICVAIRKLIVAIEELSISRELLQASQLNRLNWLLLYARVLR